MTVQFIPYFSYLGSWSSRVIPKSWLESSLHNIVRKLRPTYQIAGENSPKKISHADSSLRRNHPSSHRLRRDFRDTIRVDPHVERDCLAISTRRLVARIEAGTERRDPHGLDELLRLADTKQDGIPGKLRRDENHPAQHGLENEMCSRQCFASLKSCRENIPWSK